MFFETLNLDLWMSQTLCLLEWYRMMDLVVSGLAGLISAALAASLALRLVDILRPRLSGGLRIASGVIAGCVILSASMVLAYRIVGAKLYSPTFGVGELMGLLVIIGMRNRS